MPTDPKFPVFVFDSEESDYPLLFVAGSQEDLDAFVADHAKAAAREGDVTVPRSRFYDSSGRRLAPTPGAGQRVDFDADSEKVSEYSLRRRATEGYLAIEQFMLDEMGPEEWAATLAAHYVDGGSNPGSARHRAWHRSRRIPLNRSH